MTPTPLERIAEAIVDAVPHVLTDVEAGAPIILPRGADPFAGAERPLLLAATRWTAVSPGGVLMGGSPSAVGTVLGFEMPEKAEPSTDASLNRRATDTPAAEGDDATAEGDDATAEGDDAESSGEDKADEKPDEAKADEPRSESKSEAKAEARSEPKIEKKQRFTLQLSSFKDKDEAQAFLDQIKAAGYSATMTKADVDGKQFYRVRMGTYSSVDAANDAKAEFEKSAKKSALVTKL